MKSFKSTDDILEKVAVPEAEDISVLLSDTSKLEKCKCSYNKRFTVFKKDIDLLNKVSNKNYEFAIMSSNAYDKDLQIDLPGWKRTKRVISKHGFSADIYTSEDDKRVVIAFRGTENNNIKDWKYGNLDTNLDGQYGDADNLFKAILSEHPEKTIMTTGHSLGGGLAIHISVLNKDVDAVVFNPSPRLFVKDNYNKYDNEVTIINETGEILAPTQHLFSTIKKVKHTKYRYNFIGGHVVTEHSIATFARCMYASIHTEESNYNALCKKNTLSLKTKELIENISYYFTSLSK